MRTSKLKFELVKDRSHAITMPLSSSPEGLVGPAQLGGVSQSSVVDDENQFSSKIKTYEYAVDPILSLKVHVQMLSEVRNRIQFINREISYLLKL
jgi:hypothetical protein